MIYIIIFIISIFSIFIFLSFRVWEIKNGYKSSNTEEKEVTISHIPFRQIEKNMLYLTKHVAQWLVLVTVKYWFIGVIKVKKAINNKIPQIRNFIKKRKEKNKEKNISFFKRAVLESKFKIKRMKQKIQEEIE